MVKRTVEQLQIQMSAHRLANLLTERLICKNPLRLPQSLLGDRADLVRHDNRVLRLTSFASLQQDLGRVDAPSRLAHGQWEHRDNGQRFIDGFMRDHQNGSLTSLFSSYDRVQMCPKDAPLE